MTSTPQRSPAAWVCRRWVWVYTRKLPADHAQRRREEIESDLFEHATEAQRAGVDRLRLDAEVLARVLVGVPADLTWRRATRGPQQRLALGGSTMSLSTSTSNRLLNILGGIVIAWVLFWTVGAAVLFRTSTRRPGQLATDDVLHGSPADRRRRTRSRSQDPIDFPTPRPPPHHRRSGLPRRVAVVSPHVRPVHDRDHRSRCVRDTPQDDTDRDRLNPTSTRWGQDHSKFLAPPTCVPRSASPSRHQTDRLRATTAARRPRHRDDQERPTGHLTRRRRR